MNRYKRIISVLLVICMSLLVGCSLFKQDIFTGTVTVNKTYIYEVNLGEKTKINMSIFPEAKVADKDSDFVVSCNLTNINVSSFTYSFGNDNNVNIQASENSYTFTINKRNFNSFELQIEVIGIPREEGVISITLTLDNIEYSFVDIDVINKTIYQTFPNFKYVINDYEEIKNQAYSILSELKDAFDNNESNEIKATLENDFLDLYEVIEDECTKAMILYNNDLTNTLYKEKYEILDNLVNDLNIEYNKFFVENPEELEELTQLLNDNTRIELEYDMINNYDSDSKVLSLYEQVVKNNKRIAEIKGYNNYMDYAYENMYNRDYTPEEVQKIYEYVKKYIAPLFKDVSEAIESKLKDLNDEEYNLLLDITEENYKYFEIDYITKYINTYSVEIKEAMQSMFISGNVLFSNNIESKDSAYTTNLNSLDEPLAYFGKINQNLFTIIHEMGHYVNEKINNDTLSFEMYETHSQGNELMFLSYLKSVVSGNLYECIELYQMYNYISVILHAIAVDEFEQFIYNNDINSDEYDTKFTEICDKYEIDVYTYWRYVTVTNCAYYISYAVSLIPVLDLYMTARTDFNKGQEIYVYMLTGEETNYFERLTNAGLMNILEEEDYKRFSNLLIE